MSSLTEPQLVWVALHLSNWLFGISPHAAVAVTTAPPGSWADALGEHRVGSACCVCLTGSRGSPQSESRGNHSHSDPQHELHPQLLRHISAVPDQRWQDWALLLLLPPTLSRSWSKSADHKHVESLPSGSQSWTPHRASVREKSNSPEPPSSLGIPKRKWPIRQISWCFLLYLSVATFLMLLSIVHWTLDILLQLYEYLRVKNRFNTRGRCQIGKTQRFKSYRCSVHNWI